MTVSIKDWKVTAARNPVMTGSIGLLLVIVLIALISGSGANSDPQNGAEHRTSSPSLERASTKAVSVGKDAGVKTTFFGCGDLGEFAQLKNLQRAHDGVAMRKFVEDHDCPVLERGTKAMVENYSIMHRAFCVRPVGNPACVWFPQEFVEPS